MKKHLVLATAILGITAGTASAQITGGGFNVQWNDCSGPHDVAFDCVSNDGAAKKLVSTFNSGPGLADFVGCTTILQVQTTGPLPPWWHLEGGGCRDGSLAQVGTTGLGAGCVNPYAGAGANPSGGFLYTAGNPTPNRAKIEIDYARANIFALVANTKYVSCVMTIDNLNPVTCPGCASPQLRVSGTNAANIEVSQLTAAGQGGSTLVNSTYYSGGGPATTGGGIVASRQSTWGSIKTLYR